MEFIIMALIVALVVTIVSFLSALKQAARSIERMRNQHVAREAELLDRIMHQSGHTWTPPPRPAPIVEDNEPTEEGWTPV